jgi:hypothetical protein
MNFNRELPVEAIKRLTAGIGVNAQSEQEIEAKRARDGAERRTLEAR